MEQQKEYKAARTKRIKMEVTESGTLMPLKYSQVISNIPSRKKNEIIGYIPFDNFIPANVEAEYYLTNISHLNSVQNWRHDEIKFVYFLLDKNKNTVKIGNSINPTERARTIARDLNANLELVLVIPGTHIQEMIAHKVLSRWNVCGEWFLYNRIVKEKIEFWEREQRIV